MAVSKSVHYNTTYKAESYKGLYAMHKYWGKKPANIIAECIRKYTRKGDIVLDPFCGSGVSVSEAVFNERKGIGIDINPSSILITKNVIRRLNTAQLLEEFHRIKLSVEEKIQSLYRINRNGEIYNGQNFLWEQGILSEIRYTQRNNQTQTEQNLLWEQENIIPSISRIKKKYTTKPNTEDIITANKITYDSIPLFFPKQYFFHNTRINAHRDKHTADLFTPRNLYALALIFSEIEKIHKGAIKDFFQFCFTASIGQASKMVFIIKRRNKNKGQKNIIHTKEIGSWVIGYWTPKDFSENNVWSCFENRFCKIIKAKKEQEQLKQSFYEAACFSELHSNANFLTVKQPAQNYLKELPANSIHYILADPPHGNRIPYLELSMLWNSWLQEKVDFSKEIVVSESKERRKDKTDYINLLYETIEQSFRVLKPKGHLSFMFNSLDDNAWLNSIEMFRKIGFILESVNILEYSAKSVLQDNKKHGLQTDFIITYSKPLQYEPVKALEVIEISNNREMIDTITHLKKNGYKFFQIMNALIQNLLEKNQFFRISELIQIVDND